MNRIRNNPVILAWFLLIVLSFIWGSSFILMKKGLVVFSAGEVGAIRILSASIVLLPLSLPKVKKLKKKQWHILFISGLVGSFLPAFLFATAQTEIESSITGILNALTPLFVLILGVLFFDQSINIRGIIGIILGLLGTSFLIFSNQQGLFYKINLFALLIVLATFFYGTNLNIIKKYLQDLNPRIITSVSLLLVGPLAGFYLFGISDFTLRFSEFMPAMKALSYVLILGVIGTGFALILFNKLLQLTSPLFTSTVTYMMPVVAVMWGILDGEQLLPVHFLGMTAIMVSVYIINKSQKR